MLTDSITTSGGSKVHEAGDAILAEFSSVTEAVDTAVEFQKLMAARESDLDESILSSFGGFKQALKLIEDLIILSKANIDEYELEDRVQSTLQLLDTVLRKFDTKPVYRDMIRCGVKTALKNINYKNRERLGY